VLRQLVFAQPPARRSQRQQQLSTDEAIDYSTLEVRQLGDIYEGLLGAHLEIDSGRLALKNERGENHRQGIYYTPDWVVRYLVRETLSPLFKRIEQTASVKRALAARSDEKKRDNSFAYAVLQLNVVDPAMGSGHFLVRAVEWLAAEIVRHPTTRRMTAQVIAHGERRRSRDEILQASLIPVAPGMSQEQAEIAYWRRRVVEACIYGVDLNPLAVELTKLSLWLTCIAIDQPLNFLDHHLRSGNSTHTSSEEAWRAALARRSGFLEDLYLHFTELGFQILRRRGHFGFIISDTFFTLASKLQMRETLQRNTLTHLGQCDPFEATVDAAIFVAEKTEPAPDHQILFVQARPRKNEHGEYTKPEKDLPELPSLGAIEWNGDTTFVESIGATVRHGTFRSLRLHSMPLALPIAAHKRAFFEPRLQTLALFDRYNAKVKTLVGDWWGHIEDSKNFAQNLQRIRDYHRTLKPGDVTLVGLIAEGGQGMRTADNARFLGYLEGTPQADEIESASRDWSERWMKNVKLKPRFIDALKKSGGNPTKPAANRAAWEAAVAELRREFAPKDLGLGRMALYRIVPKNLIAQQSDFEFTWQQRKKELLAHWQQEATLSDFWQSPLELDGKSVRLEKWKKAKAISDAEFCQLCQALLRWFAFENSQRREVGKQLIPKSAHKLRSGENYRDPVDAPRIATIYNGLSGRGIFVPFRKGDPEGSRWIDNDQLFIDWRRDNVVWLFQNSGRPESNMPVVRNAHLYLTRGVTYTLLGNHVPLKAKIQPLCVFDAGASRLTPNRE
jgi:hypothetical protein